MYTQENYLEDQLDILELAKIIYKTRVTHVYMMMKESGLQEVADQAETPSELRKLATDALLNGLLWHDIVQALGENYSPDDLKARDEESGFGSPKMIHWEVDCDDDREPFELFIYQVFVPTKDESFDDEYSFGDGQSYRPISDDIDGQDSPEFGSPDEAFNWAISEGYAEFRIVKYTMSLIKGKIS